jgi:hypothetical protein
LKSSCNTFNWFIVIKMHTNAENVRNVLKVWNK